MKLTLFIFFIFCCSCALQKQEKTINEENIHTSVEQGGLADFVISFTSVCCGTASKQPVIDYINNFNLSQNTQFERVIKISNIGKEGEFMIVLFVDNWSENQKQKFYDGLQKIHWENEDSSSFGNVFFNTNYELKTLQNQFPYATFSEVAISEI